MKTLKIAMLGFGNAGRAFAHILLEKHAQMKKDYDCDVQVVAITTGHRGSLLAANTCQPAIGLNLASAIRQIEEEGQFNRQDPCYCTLDSMGVLTQVDYDVAIELTPLEIFSGEPATTHLRTAMNRGKHVITANKGPIAWAFDQLSALAEEKGVLFFYETTVMDGTPIFNLVDETLKYCNVTAISGILNTTTNFVLAELAQGKSYEAAMEEGRKRGFVEADPSMDMDGWDAAAKTTALLNVLMKAGITPKDIDRTGIADITSADIKAADEKGCLIKLLCQGTVENGRVLGSVKPTLVPKDQILAHIDGTSSVVSITTDLMGKLTIIEHDPELLQTGYGIFSDLMRIISRQRMPL